MNNSVDILLSTYNGERFLSQQIDSIINQLYTNWRLIIRDDGSADNTSRIIAAYVELIPDRILVIDGDGVNLGPLLSFHVLAQRSTAPYIAFCDQDDIWLPEKLSLQMSAMHGIELDVGRNMPLLVHSDLMVIDEQQNLVSASYWAARDVRANVMNNLSQLLTKNYVTGCTVFINRSLLELALPFPENAVMHDWWLALLAVSNGRILDMQNITVRYRRHESNVIADNTIFISRLIKAFFTGGIYLKNYLVITKRQAFQLLEADKVTGVDKDVVNGYSGPI